MDDTPSWADFLPANEFLATVAILVAVAWAVCWFVVPFLIVGMFDRLGAAPDELREINARASRPRSKPGSTAARPDGSERGVKPLLSSPPPGSPL